MANIYLDSTIDGKYTHAAVIKDVENIIAIAKALGVDEREDGLFGNLHAARKFAENVEVSTEAQASYQSVHILKWSIDRLDAQGISYVNQLKKMKKGDANYGTANIETRFYKDFEFEMAIGAALSTKFPSLRLGQTDAEYDVDLGTVKIECKHPNSNDLITLQTYIADFNCKLYADGKKYGIFALALEDMFNTGSAPSQKLAELSRYESVLQNRINNIVTTALIPFIASQRYILGVITSWTFSGWVESEKENEMRLIRMVNANYIDRSIDSQLKLTTEVNDTLKALAALPTVHRISCDAISADWARQIQQAF